MSTTSEDLIGRRITELRENTDFLSTLLRSTVGYAIVVADFDGNIIAYSEGAHRVFGYAAEDVVGQRNIETFFPQDFVQAGELQRLVNALLEEGCISFEGEKVRQSGERFPAHILFTQTKDNDGKLVGFVEIVEDFTERKKAEEALARQAEELERSNTELAALNEEQKAFSYSVSHDLRAPLRVIDGFSQALLEDYGDSLDDQGKAYLGRVRAASQRMGELIDDLLTLSRVTRGDLCRETLDMGSLARRIAGELEEAQPERRVDFAIAEGLTAEGDERLLRIVLENLLGNAWKFTSKHPQARIEFGATEQNGTRVFFVRDDGAGFDMSYAGKLFGPFQRLHAIDEFPGTGIGLATVQRIIHRHGGRVWAEGEVERGATIYFTL